MKLPQSHGLAFLLAAILPLLAATPASAHQPQVVHTDPVMVTQPEISKAYYDELRGAPRAYRITSTQAIPLYLQLTVPRSSNPNGRYSADVYRLTPTRELLLTLGPGTTPWAAFFEPFAGDWYLQGPELRQTLEAGDYEVDVSSEGNRGKYVLAIGEKESFTPAEIAHALAVIPGLKRTFIEQSPTTFVLSVFGSVYLVIALVGGGLLWFLTWLTVRLMTQRDGGRKRGNVGTAGRLTRAVIAAGLVAWAIMTTWNIVVLLAAGAVLCEALFAWSLLNVWFSHPRYQEG